MNERFYKKSRAGFTLIELVVTMIVGALGVALALGLFLAGHREHTAYKLRSLDFFDAARSDALLRKRAREQMVICVDSLAVSCVFNPETGRGVVGETFFQKNFRNSLTGRKILLYLQTESLDKEESRAFLLK
jgi:prepilin-type N-terminal cleavage/methylation domain-containing protein